MQIAALQSLTTVEDNTTRFYSEFLHLLMPFMLAICEDCVDIIISRDPTMALSDSMKHARRKPITCYFMLIIQQFLTYFKPLELLEVPVQLLNYWSKYSNGYPLKVLLLLWLFGKNSSFRSITTLRPCFGMSHVLFTTFITAALS